MQLTPELLKKSLSKVQDPDIKRDLVSLGMIQGIEIEGNKVRFTVVLTTPACPLKEVIKNNCLEVLTEDFGTDWKWDITMTATVTTVRDAAPVLPQVKNIIAIASGKGGVGKSTFLNLIQGLEEADSGKINVGETVVFGNYSQQGLVMDEQLRVIEFVKDIAENFPLASGGTLSAAQFLQRFLFDPDKQYTYIHKLSGGEKRRLHLLSILFKNPNFLILDEPTNDLDLPTLSILEEFLMEYPGCMLIVSHDRYFMDRLVDHLFVFEGDGVISDFPGNYAQYRMNEKTGEKTAKSLNNETEVEPVEPVEKSTKPKQLSFKEKREFETLEKEIPQLQEEKIKLTEEMSNSELAYAELEKITQRFTEINRLLEEKEWRWLELSQ